MINLVSKPKILIKKNKKEKKILDWLQSVKMISNHKLIQYAT